MLDCTSKPEARCDPKSDDNGKNQFYSFIILSTGCRGPVEDMCDYLTLKMLPLALASI